MDSSDFAAKVLISFFSFHFCIHRGMPHNLFQKDNVSKGRKLLVIR